MDDGGFLFRLIIVLPLKSAVSHYDLQGTADCPFGLADSLPRDPHVCAGVERA